MGMNQYTEQLEALTEIRSMMEKSTRFLSLSGATGISIGIIALISATICFIISGVMPFEQPDFFFNVAKKGPILGLEPHIFIVALMALTVILASAVGFYFTHKKTQENKVALWTKSFRLMAINIAIPMLTGGIFCIFLLLRGFPELVAPTMLIFYGFSLINGAKYTLQDVNSLGILEIILGLIALSVNKYGLEFWAIGFGIFHIIYGAKIYFSQAKS